MIFKEVLDRTDHISIADMSHEEWLTQRRGFVGGSDAGAIKGLSNYGSKLTVYLEKKGLAKTEGNDAMLRGSIMEPYTRELTRKEFPYVQIEEAPFIFKSKDNPFMGANVDGFISFLAGNQGGNILSRCKGLGIHEIKTSQDGYGFSENEIPDSYYAQIQHYLSVTGLAFAVLTVYIIAKNEIRHYPIDRNDEFIASLIAAEKDFWENNFLKDEMPPAIGLSSEEDMITGMFTGSETLTLDNPQRVLCGEYVLLNQQIKELEEQKQAIKVNLMKAIVERAQGATAERKVSAIAGPYSVLWTTVERKDIDRDALKKAGLFEKFQKTSTYDRLVVTEKKGA
jgi:putative phage-type endonuclease